MKPWLLVVVTLTVSCGEAPLLDLRVVTPEGADPLADVEQLRLVVTNPAGEATETVADASSFSVELELEVHGEVGSIVLEGRTAGQLTARGETPPLVLVSDEGSMALLVGAAGELSPLRPRLKQPGLEMVTVLLPASGVLLAGGEDGSGKPQSAAALYDFLEHELVDLPSMPSPRAGAVAAPCGGRCAVVATGVDDGGLAGQLLRFDGTAWDAVDDGLAPVERRRNAGIAALPDGTFLVLGGEGAGGTRPRSALVLDPLVPGLTLLGSRAGAGRVRPAVAVANGVVLAAGGQAAGEPAAELFYSSSGTFQAVTLPGPPLAAGAAAVALEDDRLAIVGGRDATGKLLTDGWIIDPVSLKVTHQPTALTQGRAGHRVLRVGAQLVVVGGARESGLADQAEVLSAKDLKPLRQLPQVAGREGAGAVPLGKGSLLVAGAPGRRDRWIEWRSTRPNSRRATEGGRAALRQGGPVSRAGAGREHASHAQRR